MERYSFDADYLQRLRDGDEATEDHFARYFGDLLRIKARSSLGATAAADDVQQETLLRVLRNVRRGAVEHPERLGAYVNSVSKNVMLELFRRDQKTHQFPEEGPEIASQEEGAEAGVLQDERKDLVKRALDELPAKDRELLRRVFLAEEDKDKVCQEYDVNRDYLRVLLHRARRKLRASLDKTWSHTAG